MVEVTRGWVVQAGSRGRHGCLVLVGPPLALDPCGRQAARRRRPVAGGRVRADSRLVEAGIVVSVLTGGRPVVGVRGRLRQVLPFGAQQRRLVAEVFIVNIGVGLRRNAIGGGCRRNVLLTGVVLRKKAGREAPLGHKEPIIGS